MTNILTLVLVADIFIKNTFHQKIYVISNNYSRNVNVLLDKVWKIKTFMLIKLFMIKNNQILIHHEKSVHFQNLYYIQRHFLMNINLNVLSTDPIFINYNI